MMGTFLRILGAVKTLLRSVAMVALCASVLGLANTLLLSVAERNFEFSLYRALGASRGQIFALLAAESLILTLAGVAAGLVLPALAAPVLAPLLSGLLPFGQRQSPFLFSAKIAAYTTSLAMLAAIIVSLLPAWRAARNEPAAVLKGSE
jgi:putative ABC transport system permease protein